MRANDPVYDAFFSYHWRDRDQVEPIARALHQRHLRVFLDRWYLAPGRPWPQALEEAISACRATVVFIGPEGLGRWQQREKDLALAQQARRQGFPVIPVLLAGADPPLGFLQLNTWIDLRSGATEEATLETLVSAIRGEAPGPDVQARFAQGLAAICPYRGLREFREEDALFFFGRTDFVRDELVKALVRKPFVAVVGASGSGKSSVVYAGLIPFLREMRDKGPSGAVWEFVTLSPRDKPFVELAASLTPLLEPTLSERRRLEEARELARDLAAGDIALGDVASRVLAKQRGTDRLLLVVDQWEELYTLTADDQVRRQFVLQLLEAAACERAAVVITMRGDFYGHALADRALSDRLQGAVVNLGPMTRDELRAAIEGPAAKVGLTFEDGLVERMLDDAGEEPGNLPLLEFVLTGLWERRRAGVLHHAAYDDIGRLRGAIATRAEAEYAALTEAEKAAAKLLLLQLVRPGEGTEDTRQPVELPEGDDAALEVVRKLVKARLLVAAKDKDNRPFAQVAHEALIREWRLLREWVNEDREFLRTRGRVQAAALLWEKEGRQMDRLLPPGRPLAEAEDIQRSRRDHLPPRLIEFIEASIRADRVAQDAARAAERRRLVRTRIGASVMAVLFAAASALGAYAYDRSLHAQRQTKIAQQQTRIAQRQTEVAERRAGDLAAALAGMRASQIWSRLEFAERGGDLLPHQLDALWELASGEPEVREAFLKQLAANRSFVLKLAERPKPILRALGLRLRDEQKQLVVNAVLDAVENVDNEQPLLQLLAIGRELGVVFTAEQAVGPLHRVLAVFVDSFSSDKQLLENLKALALRVSPDEVTATAENLLRGIHNEGDAETLNRQVQALRALPVPLTEEQIRAASGRILNAARMVYENPHDAGDVAEALEALPVAFTAEEAEPVTRRLVEAIESSATDLIYLDELTQAAEAIATKLTPEPPRQQFRQQVQNAIGGRFLSALRATSDSSAMERLVGSMARLRIPLSGEKVQAALDRVFDVVRSTDDPNALPRLMASLGQMAPLLSGRQAATALGEVLGAATRMNVASRKGHEAARAVRALTARLSGNEARAALDGVLDELAADSGPVRLAVSGLAVQELASLLPAEEAQAGVRALLKTIPEVSSDDARQALALAVREPASRLSPDEAQAALRSVLSTMSKITEGEAPQLLALTVHVLAVKLAGQEHQARAALDPILDVVAATISSASEAGTDNQALLWPLLQAAQELKPQLTPDQAQALDAVLERAREVFYGAADDALRSEVEALETQAQPEFMQQAIEHARRAAANTPDGFLLFAGVMFPMGEDSAAEALATTPTPQAETALEAILHAMFSPTRLGAWLLNVDEIAEGLGLPEPRGVLVADVVEGGPAQEANILPGDVIIEFDGKAVDHAAALMRLVGRKAPGDEAVVKYWRAGEEKETTLTLGENKLRFGDRPLDWEEADYLLATAGDALGALPVKLSDEQGRVASAGILKVLQKNPPGPRASETMADFVGALGSRLGDEGRTDLLRAARTMLAEAGNGHEALSWARAYEATVSLLPDKDYVAALVHVLKYPTTATDIRYPTADELASATEHLRRKLAERFPDAAELKNGSFQQCVDWIAKRYPEIDLTSAPVRPQLS